MKTKVGDYNVQPDGTPGPYAEEPRIGEDPSEAIRQIFLNDDGKDGLRLFASIMYEVDRLAIDRDAIAAERDALREEVEQLKGFIRERQMQEMLKAVPYPGFVTFLERMAQEQREDAEHDPKTVDTP